MSKFYKYAGIFAGIFFGIGLVFAIIGAVMGAKGVIVMAKDTGFQVIDDFEVYEHKDMDMVPFNTIYIDTNTADIDIIASSDGKYGVDISVMSAAGQSVEFENKDGVLTIKDNGIKAGFFINLNPWTNTADNKIKIYVPEDVQLATAELNCAFGDINVENISGIDVLKISANAGDVDIIKGLYHSMRLNVDVGDVNLERINVCVSLEVIMDVGDLDINGRIDGNIGVTLNIGDVDMSPGGGLSNYRYTLSTNAGDIDAFGYELEGVKREITGNKNGKYSMFVEVDLGSITVK